MQSTGVEENHCAVLMCYCLSADRSGTLATLGAHRTREAYMGACNYLVKTAKFNHGERFYI